MQDKVVAITGASRGIGAETARIFARAGAKVALLARSAGLGWGAESSRAWGSTRLKRGAGSSTAWGRQGSGGPVGELVASGSSYGPTPDPSFPVTRHQDPARVVR